MNEMIYRCIDGGLAGNDGVCVEHGETACVIGVRMPSPQDFSADRSPQREREREMASVSFIHQH